MKSLLILLLLFLGQSQNPVAQQPQVTKTTFTPCPVAQPHTPYQKLNDLIDMTCKNAKSDDIEKQFNDMHPNQDPHDVIDMYLFALHNGYAQTHPRTWHVLKVMEEKAESGLWGGATGLDLSNPCEQKIQLLRAQLAKPRNSNTMPHA